PPAEAQRAGAADPVVRRADGDHRDVPASHVGRGPGAGPRADGVLQVTEDYLQAALDLAKQGLEVLPLVPRGKAPACAHGKDDATRDTAQIHDWWTRMPNANIGVRPTEGMVVIDIDPRSGGSLVQLGVL